MQAMELPDRRLMQFQRDWQTLAHRWCSNVYSTNQMVHSHKAFPTRSYQKTAPRPRKPFALQALISGLRGTAILTAASFLITREPSSTANMSSVYSQRRSSTKIQARRSSTIPGSFGTRRTLWRKPAGEPYKLAQVTLSSNKPCATRMQSTAEKCQRITTSETSFSATVA